MFKKLSFTAILLCFCLLLGACAGDGSIWPFGNNEDEKSSIEYKLNMIKPNAYNTVNGLSLEPGSCISIIGRYSGDSYWDELEDGARQAIEDLNELLGYTGSDKIKLSFCAPNIYNDVDEQVNLLDEELDRAPAAIAIATADKYACQVQFDLAAENSIPIITFDTKSIYKNIASHISTNNLEAAQTAAKQLAALMENTGEIAIFAEDSLSQSCEDRVQGFLETIASDFPNISTVNVYYLDQVCASSHTTAEKAIKNILKNNPNIKGIYATDAGTSQSVANVLKSLKKTDLKFVAFDAGNKQVRLLENGTIDGLIVQNPYGMGYATVVAAIRIALGLGNESFVNTGYVWITKEMLEDPNVKKMLY